jgi:hypothetical protein
MMQNDISVAFFNANLERQKLVGLSILKGVDIDVLVETITGPSSYNLITAMTGRATCGQKMRKEHARKTSQKDTNEDVMHMLLASSDPLISSMREPKTRKK